VIRTRAKFSRLIAPVVIALAVAVGFATPAAAAPPTTQSTLTVHIYCSSSVDSCSGTFNHTNSNPVTLTYQGNNSQIRVRVLATAQTVCSYASSQVNFSGTCSNILNGTYTLTLENHYQTMSATASFTL